MNPKAIPAAAAESTGRTLRLRLSRQPTILLLVALLAVSVAQTGYLLRLNRKYLRAYQDFRERLRADGLLKPGDVVLPVSGVDITGFHHLVRPDPAWPASMVVTFSADCPACMLGLATFRSLAGAAAAHDVRVIWVTRDSLATAATRPVIGTSSGLVLAEPTYATYVALKLARVPQLAIVSAAGEVEAAWPGVLDEQEEGEVLEALSSLGDKRRSRDIK